MKSPTEKLEQKELENKLAAEQFILIHEILGRKVESTEMFAVTDSVLRLKKLIQSEVASAVNGQTKNVDRFEVIDDIGRAYVKGSIYGSPVKVELSYQDEGRTLKVFVTELREALRKDSNETL